MTTDLTACTCPQNIPSLAKGSSEDGVPELMTVSGKCLHVPWASTNSPFLCAPYPYTGWNTRVGEPLPFKLVRDHYVLKIYCQTSDSWLLNHQQRVSKAQSRTQEHQNYPQTIFTGNIQFLHCPFHLNAKGKKEISISTSAHSLYGEMLDNLCYL